MKIKELLTDESKWIKHCLARDKNEIFVEPEGNAAVKFCIVGAACLCYQDKKSLDFVICKMWEELNRHPVLWNNAPERTFQEVKDLINKLDI